MLAATRLRYALALVASAGLAGCSIYADGSDSSDTTGTDQVSQCVHDVIADCYLNQLPADVCAQSVLTQCNLSGTGPGPVDPTCYDEVMRACLESGGDPMLCDLRASESCGGAPSCDPSVDPMCTPGCQPGDPSCDPYNDCFQRTFDECLSMNGDPEQCRLYADQICGGTGCDPMTDPTCTPGCQPGDPSCDPGSDCFDRVFADCLAQTNDPMICIEIATQTCGGGTPGCDPMTDPNCVPGCDPMTDPTCGGGGPSCYDQVFRDCLLQGLDPMTCDQEASAACGEPPPPPPCDPNDPMCGPPPGCDPADPMCVPPPSCDPSDPNCPQPPPPPPCTPGDPMCTYP